MRIVYRGNFQPDLPAGIEPWSTEHHVAGSLERLGHEVVRVQEDRDDWMTTLAACATADLFLWTCTTGFARLWPKEQAEGAISALNRMLPTVGVHLDLWWGLGREADVMTEPFFRLRWLFTADGDHDEAWKRAGIRHRWMPPAVYGPECVPGTPNPEWASDVAFIGSWEGYGHAEWWPHRKAMLDACRAEWGDRFVCWPRQGRGAVRGQNLNDLLASVKVVVGDSCLADRSRRYFSDRAFETVGRGGFLVHPYIEGLEQLLPFGKGVRYYAHGDHDEMVSIVNRYLEHPDRRETERAAGLEYVREHHTYERRLEQVLATVEAEGGLSHLGFAAPGVSL